MAPPIKKKKEEVKRAPDGIIRFEADKISTLEDVYINEDGRFSSEIEVKGIPCIAKVWRDEDINVSFRCNVNQLSPWAIEGDVEFTLLHSDLSKNLTVQKSMSIDFDHYYVHATLLDWDEFIEDKKFEGFIIDDKITIEIRCWISNMKGIKRLPRFNFADSNNPRSDVALVVEGVKFYVNKEILASHSTFFDSLFFGEFAEKEKKEIELKDVDGKEFHEMLQVIYPSNKMITDDSAEYLIKLGDRFQIMGLVDRAEKHLIGEDCELSVPAMLRIADKYNLYGLMEHCLSELRSKQDFKDVKESPIFNEISDATKAILFSRLLEID